MRSEDDVPVGTAHLVREDIDEGGLVVPALDEAELDAACERLFELIAVALDREGGVVRREDEPDDAAGSAGKRVSAASAMRGGQCFIPVYTGARAHVRALHASAR